MFQLLYTKSVALCNMAPLNVPENYKHFESTCPLHRRLPWLWRQQLRLKRRHAVNTTTTTTT